MLGSGLGLEPPDDDGAARSSGAGAGAGAVSASSAAVRLRAEKKRLQTQLRAFEAAFEAREKRRVKFVKDIAPVLADYTRYKEVKSALAEIAASEGI
jgi:hypothetical protein